MRRLRRPSVPKTFRESHSIAGGLCRWRTRPRLGAQPDREPAAADAVAGVAFWRPGASAAARAAYFAGKPGRILCARRAYSSLRMRCRWWVRAQAMQKPARAPAAWLRSWASRASFAGLAAAAQGESSKRPTSTRPCRSWSGASRRGEPRWRGEGAGAKRLNAPMSRPRKQPHAPGASGALAPRHRRRKPSLR